MHQTTAILFQLRISKSSTNYFFFCNIKKKSIKITFSNFCYYSQLCLFSKLGKKDFFQSESLNLLIQGYRCFSSYLMVTAKFLLRTKQLS